MFSILRHYYEMEISIKYYAIFTPKDQIMTHKVRWGIVGPGTIAHQFANDIKFCQHAEIVGVASNSPQRAKEFALKYNIPKHYSAYSDLYNDDEVDAIYIATTHNFHKQNGIEAIDAGKAVLCEKPLTDNLQDTIELIDHANSRNIYLMEAMWTYFLPPIRKAQEWIDAGKIGEVINVKSNFGYPKQFDPNSRLFDPNLSGGCLLDMGIYTVAMAWLFMKMDPKKYNIVSTKAPSGVDYDVNMQLVYPDNKVANLHSSFKAKLNNHTYIIGKNGYIDIPDFWRANNCTLYQEEKIINEFHDTRKGLGFEFEIEAASKDILASRTESDIMPHSYSIKFQEHIKRIMIAIS